MTVRRTPAAALNELRGKDRRLASVVGAPRMRIGGVAPRPALRRPKQGD